MNTSTNPTVRTRMAPSPTGEYHVGHIATLLKNYAFAHQQGGQFLLRVEDTDQERLVEGAVERILQVIRDYGLSWDEGPDVGGPHAPYVQSERLPIYKEKAEELVEKGEAYYCFCDRERLETMRADQRARKVPPKYDRYCRRYTLEEARAKVAAGESYVIRLKVPDNVPIVFTDWIRGEITVNSDIVDDQVLLKSDGFPTYHLGVVVDDHMMEITHIMRGEEWISSTPKHILLYRAFGWTPPIYAHLPVFLNPDGQGKMSKRKGTVSARSFLDAGYLPEALLNFFMILGWSPKDGREMLTLEEYIQEFDPRTISAKSVVFDIPKLDWINGQYIRKLDRADLLKRLQPYIPSDFPKEKLEKILDLVVERLVKLSEFEEVTSFFYRPIEVTVDLLLKKSTKEQVTEELKLTLAQIAQLTSWTTESIEEVVRKLQEEHNWKKNQYFMMLRVAVTGRQATPPLFETMEVIGQDAVMSRLDAAITSLQ
jgi:glutamyl-tRNA synthetase